MVIVGGGVAGATAALELRREGYDGPIRVMCAEPHPPYHRPPLSKAFLLGKWPAAALPLRPAAVWAKQRIDLELGVSVDGVDVADRRVSLSDGRTVGYESLLFATGGTPRSIKGVGGDSHVVTLRTREDAERIRDVLVEGPRVAVIGGGFIGAEIAASAVESGCAVTMLEAAEAPFDRVLPRRLGEIIAQRHRDRGVDIRLGAFVSGIEDAGDVRHVRCADGRQVTVELVVVGIGITPNDQLAAAAGLEVDDGIVVDEYCRTSVEGAYAVGDVARCFHPRYGRHLRVEHWQSAQRQAAVAARNMAGTPATYDEVPWAWSDQYGDSIQFAGVTADADTVHFRGGPKTHSFTALLARGSKPMGVVGLNAPDDVRNLRTILASSQAAQVDRLCDPQVDLAELARGVDHAAGFRS